MKDKTPLYNRLLEHEKLDRSSFHTPGHKCAGFFPEHLLRLDYTELPDTDALYEASGVILESEKLLSELFATKRSLISAGGCSLAIQAMMKTARDRGKKILCVRNAHRSAINAMALLGLEPLWLTPQGSNGYTGRADPNEVEKLLKANSDISACYITSPSYYGELSDIAAIAEVCHQYNTILLVDNAHGSHLAFMKENLHPIALGADMSACSLHKTMPVLTGGAALNIGNETLCQNAKSAMALFGSTSPSYLIMSSVDLCIDYMLSGSGKSDYLRCEEKVAELKAMANEKGIIQPEGICDPLRLTLNTACAGILGEEKQIAYFESHEIDCEFCDGINAVLIFTPFNTDRDFERVRNAIENMFVSNRNFKHFFVPYQPKKILTLRQALLSPSETSALSEATGKIAADTACPCPPGVPIVMPGELIDEPAIKLLAEYGIEKVTTVTK